MGFSGAVSRFRWTTGSLVCAVGVSLRVYFSREMSGCGGGASKGFFSAVLNVSGAKALIFLGASRLASMGRRKGISASDTSCALSVFNVG